MNRFTAPGAPSIESHHVLVQSRTITASKCISKLAWSRPPSVSPNSLVYGLEVRKIIASKCISKLPRLRPPRAFPQTRSITASKCISNLSWSWFWSTSLNWLDQGLQVYFQIQLITASKFISRLTHSRPRSVSLSSLDYHFQAHLELLSTTTCSQSRYTVCDGCYTDT